MNISGSAGILNFFRLAFLLAVAGLAALTFTLTARATWYVDFYPPIGTWVSHGYPSSSGCIGAWNHSIVTQATRTSSTISITYYDVYGGSAQVGGVVWRTLQVADPWDSSKTKNYTAPLGRAFSADWTTWVNSTFNTTSTQHAYAVTTFSVSTLPWCQGTSEGIYGP